jgi:hypothetical protein
MRTDWCGRVFRVVDTKKPRLEEPWRGNRFP